MNEWCNIYSETIGCKSLDHIFSIFDKKAVPFFLLTIEKKQIFRS